METTLDATTKTLAALGPPDALETTLNASGLDPSMLGDFRFLYRNPDKIALIVLYAIAFTLGLVGNTLVVATIVLFRHMRSRTNAFIFNLTIADLIVVLINMPITVSSEVYSDWIYGEFLCKCAHGLLNLSSCASILSLAVICLVKFYAVSQPLQASRYLSRRRAALAIVSIWCASLGLTVVPTVITRHTLTTGNGSMAITLCAESWPSPVHEHVYNASMIILFYLLPLSVIFAGHFQISRRLWSSTDDEYVHETGLRNANSALRSRRKVVRLLLTLVVIFAVTWLPSHVLYVLAVIERHKIEIDTVQMDEDKTDLLNYFHSFALWLAHANSTINPICYAFMSEKFRRCLTQCRTRRRQSDYGSSTTGETTNYRALLAKTQSLAASVEPTQTTET